MRQDAKCFFLLKPAGGVEPPAYWSESYGGFAESKLNSISLKNLINYREASFGFAQDRPDQTCEENHYE
jgi:hypothetical protein